MLEQDLEHLELPGILILSHGTLCRNLIEAAKMIHGDAEGVTALPLEEGCSLPAYASNAVAVFKSMPEGSIVLFDMLFGTPFNQFITALEGNTIHGLCGVNLPVLIEALAFRENLRGAELIKALENSAHESIVNVSEFIESTQAN